MKKIVFISMMIVIIDQIIKKIVIFTFDLYQTKTIIPKFFSLTRVHNDGAAFSMLSGNVFFLCMMSIVALLFFYFYFLKGKKFTNLEIITYGLFLGGTFGNLLDRIFRGYVVDYLDFKIFGYDFPIFNFADVMIVLSISLLLIKTIKEDLWKKM